MLIQYLTTNRTPADRLDLVRRNREWLEMVWPNAKVVVHEFEAAPEYDGKSDRFLSVRQNLYENHQKCMRFQVEQGEPWSLVLEDDVVFNQVPKGKEINEWLDQNQGQWDLMFLGCAPLFQLPYDSLVDRVAAVFMHAVIYHSDLAQRLMDLPHSRFSNAKNQGHFDMYLCDEATIGRVKMFALRDHCAYQLDSEHYMLQVDQHKRAYAGTISLILLAVVLVVGLVGVGVFLTAKSSSLRR